jgi:hypothetical protein
MQRRRPGFLRTGDNEIEPLHFPTFDAKHAPNRDTAVGRCPRLSSLTPVGTSFCNRQGQRAVLNIMVPGLAKLRAGVLATVEFIIVLAVLLVLGATAIPALVRIRRR